MSKGGVHNALSRGAIPSALARAVGDMEGASGLERYGETLTPILDLWQQPEWCHLRRELLMSDDVSQGAVAGEFGMVALVNPAASGVIAIVERVTAWSSLQQFFSLFRDQAATVTGTLALIERGQPRDSRDGFGLASNGRIQLYSGSDPGLFGSRLDRMSTPSGGGNFGEFKCGLPAVVTPGWALIVACTTVNIALEANFGWRERTAYPGELE